MVGKWFLGWWVITNESWKTDSQNNCLKQWNIMTMIILYVEYCTYTVSPLHKQSQCLQKPTCIWPQRHHSFCWYTENRYVMINTKKGQPWSHKLRLTAGWELSHSTATCLHQCQTRNTSQFQTCTLGKRTNAWQTFCWHATTALRHIFIRLTFHYIAVLTA